MSSSVEDLKLKDRFDLIICSEVLEHLQDDMKALLKMNILLKDNGGIIVSVPSVNAPLYKLGLAEKFDKRVGHLRRYSLNQIVSLIEKAGFKIEETYKTEGVIRNCLVYEINERGELYNSRVEYEKKQMEAEQKEMSDWQKEKANRTPASGGRKWF